MMDNEWVVGKQTVGPLCAEMRGLPSCEAGSPHHSEVGHDSVRAVKLEVKDMGSD